MKKHLIVSTLLLVGSLTLTYAPPTLSATPSNAACTTQACLDCKARKQAAMKMADQMYSDIYNQTIQQPDTSFISQCISGMSLPNFGFSFGLPSMAGIMQKVCQMVRQQVSSTISNVSGSSIGSFSGGSSMISNAFGNGFGSGVSIPTNTTSTNLGGGSLGNVQGINGPINSNTNSNSSFIDNSVNSAMQFLTK